CLARADQRVLGCTPFSSCLLAHQDEATGTRVPASCTSRARDMLAAPSPGDRLRRAPAPGGQRPSPAARCSAHVPSVEQLDDLTAVRIVGFDGVNPLDRIATTERQG